MMRYLSNFGKKTQFCILVLIVVVIFQVSLELFVIMGRNGAPSTILSSAGPSPLSTERHVFVGYSSKKKYQLPRDISKPTSSHKKLLIISCGRSGSSFLGELFRQNSKILYIFEPLRYVYQINEKKTFKVLEDIYSCRNPDNDFLKGMQKQHYAFLKTSSKIPQLSRHHCRHRLHCLASVIQNTCKQRSTIVTKVITHRLPGEGLWGVKKLLDAHDNLKIIHLIRNPEHSISSMMETGWFGEEDFEENVNYTCSSIWRNIKYAQNNTAYFEKRYKLVVFNEMFTNPLKVVQDLYNFVEISSPVPLNVKEWISKSTKEVSKNMKNYAYTTQRNTTAVLKKTTKFSEEQSKVIWKYCHDVMKHIGTIKIPQKL